MEEISNTLLLPDSHLVTVSPLHREASPWDLVILHLQPIPSSPLAQKLHFLQACVRSILPKSIFISKLQPN